MARTCHDCGCSPGELHTAGCDVEECPTCHGQLISCNCKHPEELEPSKRIPYGQETHLKKSTISDRITTVICMRLCCLHNVGMGDGTPLQVAQCGRDKIHLFSQDWGKGCADYREDYNLGIKRDCHCDLCKARRSFNEEVMQELKEEIATGNKSLYEIKLPWRALRRIETAFFDADIRSLGTLLEYNAEEILAIRNMGPKLLQKLEEFLAELGLHLRQ